MSTGVSLTKGGNVSLTKAAPGLKNIAIGLGWDVRQTSGAAFDLDASVFMLLENGKLASSKHLVYYANLKSPEMSVVHQGDNRTGAGEGDDEVINVYLDKIPSNIQKLLFTVTVYQANERQQNFGMVQRAFIRVINMDTPSAPPPPLKINQRGFLASCLVGIQRLTRRRCQVSKWRVMTWARILAWKPH